MKLLEYIFVPGNYDLYLNTLHGMLPVLAAANRQKYTRCVRWLLDELPKLPADVKKQFEDGDFVVRQSADSVYGCAAGDYIIETQLMAPFKGKQGMICFLSSGKIR